MLDQSIEPIEVHGLTSKQAIVAVREIIRRGVLTFEADPSPYARLGIGSPSYQQQYIPDQYPDKEKRERFVPTAHDRDQAFVVLEWLQWLRKYRGTKGALAIRRILRWCHDVPNTVQAEREGCSDDTIMNRIDRDVAEIIKRFFSLGCQVQVIESPFRATDFAIQWDQERADAFGNAPYRVMEVYAYGFGVMRNGKVWDDEMTNRKRYPRRAPIFVD